MRFSVDLVIEGVHLLHNMSLRDLVSATTNGLQYKYIETITYTRELLALSPQKQSTSKYYLNTVIII